MSPYLLVAADFVRTGGMDRANHALADYLARQGGEVHLVGHGADLHLLRYPNVRWHPVPRPGGHDALGWGLLRRSGRRWARRVRARGGRVLVNGGNCPLPGAAPTDLNWVHYVHAAYAAPLAGPAWARAWQAHKHRRACADERRALAQARLVIANSEATRRHLQLHAAVPPDRIRVLYYGTDPQLFAPVCPSQRRAARAELGWPVERRTALFVGALGDRRKGFDSLLAAWDNLCRRSDWDLDLAVVGRGAELAAWRERVARAGLESRCQFLGFRHDVPRLLAASSVLVSPTRYEAYGLGVHEALARGVPALVSAAAGVAERYPAALREWLLQDPDSAAELEQRLLAWRRSDAAQAAALAAFSLDLRSRTWDDMAVQLLGWAEAA